LGSIADRLRGLLVLEAIALAIALVSPVTPSKTGSTWSPAELFSEAPSYPQKVLAAFVTVNLMLLLLGLAAAVAIKIGESGPGRARRR